MLPLPHVEAIESERGLFNDALEASRDGRFYDALAIWDRFLKLSPKDAAAWSNRGNVRLTLGDPHGAIEDQTMAIKLLPLESDPHLNRGVAEETLQRWEDAEIDYQWILDREPNDASALYNLGNVNGAKGDWSCAQALFRRASLARPGFAFAWSSEALSLYQLGDFDQAESELRRVIRKYPMHADARAALSALLWRQGLLGEAESNWAAAAGLDNRYRDLEWLLKIRRWPPQPSKDLMAFLNLETP